MVNGLGLVCLIVYVFSDVSCSEQCYSKSNDRALNLQCHKYCSEGTCPSFCVCGNKALDTCDPLNYTNNNTIQVLETVTPGTTIFTINVTGKEEWDFTLERGGVVDGSIWNHLSAYMKLTKIGGVYEMIVDRTPDLEDIFYRYAIKLTKLTIHLNCKRGSVSDLSHTITINIIPVNEYAPEFLGAPLIQSVPEDTKVDTLIYGLINHTMDMDVNPAANELAAFEIVDYLPDTRHDGRAYFDMKDSVKGCILLQKTLDFEALQPLSATRFFLNLSASDIHGNTSYTTLTINVVDVDDLPPEFYHPGCPLVATKSRPCLVSYEAAVPLNFQGPITDIVPGLIQARDMDTQDNPVEYSLEPAPGEKPENTVHFAINKTNGDVTVVSPFSKKTEINLVIVLIGSTVSSTTWPYSGYNKQAKEISEAARSTQASLYVKVDKIKSPFSALLQDNPENTTEEPNVVLGLGQTALIIIGTLSGVTLVLLLVVLFLCGKVRTLSNSVHPAGVRPAAPSNRGSPDQPNPTADQTSAPNKNNSTQPQTQPIAPLGASEASLLERDKPNTNGLVAQEGDRSHNSTSNQRSEQKSEQRSEERSEERNEQRSEQRREKRGEERSEQRTEQKSEQRSEHGIHMDDALTQSESRNFAYIRNTLSVPPTFGEAANKSEPQERRNETRTSVVLDYSNNKRIKRDARFALVGMTRERRHCDWVEYEDRKPNHRLNRKMSAATSPQSRISIGERERSPADGSVDSLSTDTLGSPRSDQREGVQNQNRASEFGVVGEYLPDDLHYSSSQSDVNAGSLKNEDHSHPAGDYNTSDVLSILPIEMPSFSCIPSENQKRVDKVASDDVNTDDMKVGQGVTSNTFIKMEGGNKNKPFPRNVQALQQFRQNTLHLSRSVSRADATNWMSNNPRCLGRTALLLNSTPMKMDVRPYSSPGEYQAVGGYGVQLPNRPWTCVYNHHGAPATAAEIEQWKRSSGTWLNAANTCVRHPSRQPSDSASQASQVTQDERQQYIHLVSQPTTTTVETIQQYIPYISPPSHSHLDHRHSYVSVPSQIALAAQHPDNPLVSQPADTLKRSPASLLTPSVTRNPPKTRPSSHVTRKSWSGIFPRPLKRVKKKTKLDLRGEYQPEEEGRLRSRSQVDTKAEQMYVIDQQGQTFQSNQSFDGHLLCEKSSQTLQEVANLARSRRLPAMRVPQHQRRLKQTQRSPLVQRLPHEQDILNVNRTHDGDFLARSEHNPRHYSSRVDDVDTRNQTTHNENDANGNSRDFPDLTK